MNEYKITLIGNGIEIPAIIQTEMDNKNYIVTLSFLDQTIKESAYDYFEAFSKIRIQLEQQNLLPNCYAASLNVWPSGMSRDMGGGLKVYKMQLGKPPTRDESADIFDTGEDVKPVSVAEQKDFKNQWFKSRGIERK